MDFVSFNCSACQQPLKVNAANAGKQAKCPRCGATLVIPAPRASPKATPPPPAQPYRNEPNFEDQGPSRPRRARPAEDDYEEDRPRPRRRREEDDYEEDRPRRRREEEAYEEDRPRRRRPDDEYEEDRPRRRRREEDDYEDDRGRPRPQGMSPRKKWGFVRVGILLVFVAACVLDGFAGFQALADFLLAISTIAEKDIGASAFPVMMKIGFGLAFMAALASIVGYVFCIFVPNKNGALPLAITALALGGVNLISSILFRLILIFKTIFDPRPFLMPGYALSDSHGGAFAISLIVVLLFAAEYVLFPLFLSAVSRTMKSRWLSGSCMGVVILAGVTAGLQIFSMIMIFAGRNSQSKAMAVVSLLLIFFAAACFLGQMIWYTLLLWRVRETIEF